MVLEPFKLAVVISLFAHGLCSVSWLNPFGGGTAIRRQKARLDRIAMEFPTGVVNDPLEANIDKVACGNVREDRYKFSDVSDEQIAHLAGRHPASVHMRFDRAPNVGRRDQNAQVRQLPRLQSLKPIPYGERK